MTLVVLALLVCLGGVIMFVYLCGMAGGATMNILLKRAMSQEPAPGVGAQSGMTADESNAIVAESQRMLRESQRREAFNKANPL
ncbi:hypothetical protein [Diaphorobacter caeni]|uniref:hypothetical protein n=1 Tax=Diaphorobacter caeni TaxID=2784387 RepID=UPI00188E0DF0|nr:hypothetical protein [Diaphorobacter caeni]MBF5003379.1 hypothetical protein [Diaphorobacter caeni]